jgi:FMN reductase
MKNGPTVALNGSPSASSRTRALAELAVDRAGGGSIIDLGSLDADALLGRRADPEVDRAVRMMGEARLIVVATPVYRATYSALTKTIYDLQPTDALVGSVTVPIATAAAPEHFLAIDHALRPLVASLGGWTTPSGVYAIHSDVSEAAALISQGPGPS